MPRRRHCVGAAADLQELIAVFRRLLSADHLLV